jgi:hypothetical protein
MTVRNVAQQQFSLELLGPIILEMRDRLARVEAKLESIGDRLDYRRDELNVVSGLAIRATGERVSWEGVQSQLWKLSARVEALEQRER